MRRFVIPLLIIVLVAIGAYWYVTTQEQPDSARSVSTSTEAHQSQDQASTPAADSGEENTTSSPKAANDDSAKETETSSANTALSVRQLKVFPTGGLVSLSGTATFLATFVNETSEAISKSVALTAAGEQLDSTKVSLAPDRSTTASFTVRDFSSLSPGEHSFTVADTSTRLKLVKTATPSGRSGELPPNPKVLGEQAGLAELGTPGGRLVISTLSAPKTLNGIVAQETSSTSVTGQIHEGLVEANPITGAIEPALATHWEFSDDKKTIVFHLRQGVKFSDGEPFTADDVVFTFNDLIFNEDVHTDARDALEVKGEPISVEKVDKYTVKVTTAEPFRPLMRSIGVDIYPKHKLADKVAKLNPGARGVLRAVRQIVDGHRDTLKAADETLIQDIDQALDTLDQAIEDRETESVTTVKTSLATSLDNLKAQLGDKQADLRAKLDHALGQLEQLPKYAEQGQWAGVPPGTFNDTWTVDTPPEQIAGLGPFKFQRYDVDQQVVLKRNPYYWKTDAKGVQLPYLDRLIFLVVKDQDVAFLKFKTGEIDTLAARPEDWPLLNEGVTAEDCTEGEKATVCVNEKQGWELLRDGPQLGTQFVVFNQDAKDPVLRAVFRNLKFRKAVAYALDKQTMIDTIYNGLALPQWSPVSMTSPFYDSEAFQKYPYNREKARRMLDEIGLRDTDGDGTRNVTDAFLEEAGLTDADLSQGQQAESARELGFLLATNSGSTLRAELGNLITTDLKKLGLNPTFKPMDFNALVTELTGGKYEAVLVGLTGGLEPHNSAGIWKTDGGLHFWRWSAKENPPAWEQRVDKLFDKAATTFNNEQVTEHYSEFQRLVSENLPLIYTVNEQFIYASKAALGNNDRFNPLGTELGFSEMLWWKDEDRRRNSDSESDQ